MSGTALVTGAASGIGREVVLTLARGGIDALALADVNESGLSVTEQLALQIAPKARMQKFTVDIGRKEQVDEMLAWTVSNFGRLNYAINAASVCISRGEAISLNRVIPQLPPPAPYSIADLPIEEYDRICNVNARGTLLCMQAEIKAMLKQEPIQTLTYKTAHPPERGTIVNLASLAGIGGISQMGPYVASKHVVVGLTRTAALEYARKGIRVNAICPAQIATPMITATLQGRGIDTNEKESAAYHANVAAKIPTGRYGYAEEVADVCVFLASSHSTFINGVTLNVDGGVMAATSFYEPVD
ncbi:uncharacterized protein Z520_11480 [Fonsecaea multimorphosa CBS 102226]|uniref:Glucose 1-dehydrogenase n=1 Tax=Fonsecaea multimorphosa CBS 102226 TaxID=1442371 RepID=A0A0D2JI06_9EURO|nr:uncharacterized protein Z520_11480 [Fonsecaea multimorphosa CBS 102226]KIX92817.1 hypothetical protein Z520_11480 [Fonsecaea multimorphosa CBS 102226]